jgi:hypothetical protein
MPKKIYRQLPVRIEDAAAMRERIAAGEASPDDVQEYRRILNIFRGKFRAGSLSPENARRFGID